MGDSICKDYICSCSACTGRPLPTLAEACEVIRELMDATPATQEWAAVMNSADDFLKRVEGK